MSKTKKLWQKTEKLDPQVEQFTIGNDQQLDLFLARWDVIGSLAHCTMLHQVKLISDSTYRLLRKGLKQILAEIENQRFQIEPGVEDIHSQVELWLTRMAPDAGARLHTGRSRNDQVLLDLRLFARDEIRKIVEQVSALFELLLDLSERYKNVLLPGYTHFQVAMPSSFGLWLAAFAESFVDDLLQLQAAYQMVNKNPLGSAAGYGSAFPLDRNLTTQLLGFEALNVNALYAQLTRGKVERVVTQAFAGLAETMSKLAMDLVLYQSQNFGFVAFPDTVTTGSSIMPHKKNPDVFEVLRGRCNKIKAVPAQIQMVTTNLPSGYHRDFQLLKEPFLTAFQEIQECLRILLHVLPQMQVKQNILKNETYRDVFSVEAVNQLVQQGVPFREAYHQVAQQLARGQLSVPETVEHTHVGSIGNLANDQIRQQMKIILKRFDFASWQQAIAALLDEEK